MVSSQPLDPNLTEDHVLGAILREFTVERLLELAETLELKTREPGEVVDLLRHDPAFGHDDALEFCTLFELKDVCRALDLPMEGGQADSLRQRIRTHLYFPPAEADDYPEAMLEGSKRRRREEARRDREYARFERQLVLRYGAGAGVGLFVIAWISPFQSLSGAIFFLPAGIIAGSIIAIRQLDHVTGSIVFGTATVFTNLTVMVAGRGNIDIFLWIIATAIGGLLALGARLAYESPKHIPIDLEGPPKRRPLLELVALLPDVRLNSLALEIDRDLPQDRSRESLLRHIREHGTFDRDRVLRNMEELELRRVARRLDMPQGDDDVNDHDLRHAILSRFDIGLDVR